MTQTSSPHLPTALDRFRAWFLALREDDFPPDRQAGQPESERDDPVEEDDGFYLALGMHRHW